MSDDEKKRPIPRLAKPNFGASQSQHVVPSLASTTLVTKSMASLKQASNNSSSMKPNVPTIKLVASTSNLKTAPSSTLTVEKSKLVQNASLVQHQHQHPIVPSQAKKQTKVQQTTVVSTEHIELPDIDSE